MEILLQENESDFLLQFFFLHCGIITNGVMVIYEWKFFFFFLFVGLASMILIGRKCSGEQI